MSHRYAAARRIIRRGGVCAAAGLVLSLTMTSTTLAAPAEGDPFTLLDTTPDLQSTYDVAIAGPGDGWVVGSDDSGKETRPYAAHWDGKKLKQVPVGDLADKSMSLWEVDATGTDDVWAAGFYQRPTNQAANNGRRPNSSLHFRDNYGKIHVSPQRAGSPHAADKPAVVGHWDGKAWTQSEVPPPADGLQGFTEALHAFAPDDVWVAGYEQAPDANTVGGKAFVHRFDGSKWKRLPLPQEITSVDSQVRDIAGKGADDVWVAGVLPTDKKDTPFVAHWDGKKFTVTKLPITKDFPNGWNADVIAVSGKDVYVTGRSFYTDRTLATAYRLDGDKWVEWKDTGLAEFNDISVNPNNGHLLAGGWPSLTENTSGYAIYDGKNWTTHAQPDKLPKGNGQVLGIDHEESSGRGFGVGYINPDDGSEFGSFLTSDTK